MKTVLDLIREFGALNDAKIRRGGTLAHDDEKRWQELKTFYDLLMSHEGLSLEEATSISAEKLRDYVPDRDRLRVPASVHVILQHRGHCHAAAVVNLSRGGMFVTSQAVFEVGSRVKLVVAKAEGPSGAILEIEGEVIWRTDRGIPEAGLPRGMGLRFLDLEPEKRDVLDTWVLEALEKRLAALW